MPNTRKLGISLRLKRSDLIDTYLCDLHKTRKNTVKGHSFLKQILYITPGSDIVNSTSEPFELTKATKQRFLDSFQASHGKWFKFVIFEYDGTQHVYVILGNSHNKHTLCILKGVLDYTKHDSNFDEIRSIYNKLIRLKASRNIYKLYWLKQRLKDLIQIYDPCLPVIVAGSGAVMEDGHICINNKSGHYKTKIHRLQKAKPFFEKITSRTVTIQRYDRTLLKSKYTRRYKDLGTICY